MTLLAIAEVMSGEALVSPGGPIDRDTAAADDVLLWQTVTQGVRAAPDMTAAHAASASDAVVAHPVLEDVLSPV